MTQKPKIHEKTKKGSWFTTRGKKSYYEFYIFDYHCEYRIPSPSTMNNREVWNGFSISKAFEAINLTDKDLNRACLKLYGDKIIEEEISDGYGTIYHIIVNESEVDNWLAKYQSKVIDAINTASGDDSFFDYMPNFVNTFMQACIFLGRGQLYNDTLAPFIGKGQPEDPDCLFEFYCDELNLTLL